MQRNRVVPFKIDSMDSLGQGVSKASDQITFIPKTLPGEEGEALIMQQKKGVAFARVEALKVTSNKRQCSPCPHFEKCPSCHYLHTSYQEELGFKKQSLEKLFHKIPHPEIQITGATRRTSYRNRIQLHYDQPRKLMGMFESRSQTIIPIPFCLIGTSLIQSKIKELYQNDSWLHQAKNQALTGHIELYEQEGTVTMSWNQAYAHGGFTQVFEEMNQELRSILSKWSHRNPKQDVLDLFGGNGNLSHDFNYKERLCVDFYSTKKEWPFFSQDLYAAAALNSVQKELRNKNFIPKTIILDPPRSGLKNLDDWLALFSPDYVAYVSCDPHTMARDISSLNNYRLTEIHLIDFFPSTFHFETMTFLERK